MLIPASAKLLILSIFLWVGHVNHVNSLKFNFTSFNDSDINKLIFSPNSRLYLGAIQVTPDVRGDTMENRAGRVVLKKKFKLWSKKGNKKTSFNTTFVLNISNMTNPGGEGIAFIVAADSAVPANSTGPWLGIVNQKTNGTAQANIVAIEFDTRKSYSDDLDSSHVGLDVNSIYSRKQVGIQITSSQDLPVLIQYDGERKILTVFVNDMKNPVLTQTNFSLSDFLPRRVYVGFSGSTSNETQLNCVRSWQFNGNDTNDSKMLFVKCGVPVIVAVVLASLGILVYWRRKIHKKNQVDDHIEKVIQGLSTAPKKFKLRQLKKATDNFSPKNKLGKGGFGTVYKGILGNKEVAVKKVSKKSTQGKTEFLAEVTTIGNLHHRNLVKLIGWCYESHEYLLVYEYLPNASLDKFIFRDDKTDVHESTINWGTRLGVISGSAQALDYLHSGCHDTVLHRDIKSSNIMLDSEFNAKLGDFGLARTINLSDQTHHSTEIAGTPGYMSPESILTGRFTVETDVYAFGVLILEVASGKKPAGNQNDYSCNLVNWIWNLNKNGSILEAADNRLYGDYEPDDMQCILLLGLACCHPNPNSRPSMKTVLQVLKGEAAAPDVPDERPVFMWPPLPPSFKELDISLGQIPPFAKWKIEELSGR